MNYFLLITDSKGDTRLVPIADIENVKVKPGDDVVVMDESGNPVDVSLRPEGSDLVIEFENEVKAVLEDFYGKEAGSEPITISLNPVEPVSEAYEFNSQTGNLPNAKSFNLMRFSNTEYVEFVEQIDELNRSLLPGGGGEPRAGGLGNGSGVDPECCEPDAAPSAQADTGIGSAGGPPIVIDLLANDVDPLGGGLNIHSIAGIGVSAGGSVTLPSGSVVTVSGGGGIEVQPGSNFDSLQEGESGTETFIYSVIDSQGRIATSQVTVTVTGVNDPPVAVEDEYELNEDGPVTVSVLDNDSDPDDSDTLTVTAISSPPTGNVNINPDNTITYDPAGGFESLAVGETATVTLTYEISDDAGATATSNVTFVVEGRNDSPDAIDDSRTVAQGTPLVIDVLSNDVDPDSSDTLTVTGVTQPGRGLVLRNEGDVVFDPGSEFDYLDAGESETVTFDYTISDGNGGTDTATVTVTVTGVEDPTVTAPDSGVADENTPIVVDVLGNDTDLDSSDIPLTVTGVTQPPAGQGSVAISNGGADVTFTPGTDFDDLAAGESETVTFTYTTDTGATETVTITVNGLNDAPEAIDDARTTDQNTAITIDAVANDIDPDVSDALIIIGVDQPGKGSVSIGSNNQLLFDPGTAFGDLDEGESETVTFDYSITDGNGGTDTATVTVTVTGTDEALIAAPDSGITDEDTTVAISVLSNDFDPDTTDNPLAIDSFDQPTPGNGSVSQVGSDLVFDPGSDFNDLAVGETAVVTFDYTVINQDGATAVETVTITVTGVNDNPVAVDDSESVTQNGTTNIDLLGADDSVSADSDPDGDSLSVIRVDGKIAGGTVILSSGATLTLQGNGTADYNPNGAFDYLDDGESAIDSFTYVISDGNGGTDTATVTVTVNGADDPLEANPDRAVTSENTPVTIDVLANDDDPDTTDKPLSVLSTSQPARGTVVNNGTDVTFDPGGDFDDLGAGESATVTFSYTAENQDGATVVETVTVTVTGENDAPETYRDTLHTMEGVGGSIDVIQNDFDAESSQLVITGINGTSVMANEAVQLSSGGFVTVMEDGRIYFNPNGDYNSLAFGETATASFTYTVADENGATAVETVNIVIDGVDNEILTAGAYQVISDQLYEIQLDPSDESIRYVPIGSPLPFNFNSIAFNANDNLIYANATGSDAGLGVNNGDTIQIDPFTGQVVGNLGQFTNDEGETIPSFAGAINSDINVYYVNGPADSGGNTAYAIDLNTNTVSAIGILPGADYGVDIITGLIWSVNGTESYSLDPTSGTLTTFSHGGLQEDGLTAAGGTYGSMFADNDGNIQVTSNSGYGLYQLDTATGALVRIGDAPATNSNDATGTRTSALPSAQPFLFLDVDGSTNASTVNDAFRSYDPDGAPVSISDTDIRIADLDGDTISSARIVLKNSFTGDTLGINGVLPGGIAANITTDGGFQILTLTGDASQGDYEAAIAAVTFSNTAPGSTPTDPREITVTLIDIDGVTGNTATSFVFVGAGSGTIAARSGQTADQSYPDQIVLHEDDMDPTTGGATFNLLENDSDSPTGIDAITQPPVGEGSVVNNNDGTVTFQPGEDFQYLSEGETAITSFTYTSNTGQTETVTVTVHGANDPIEASPDSGTTDADETLTIDVLANDRDVDAGDQPLSLTAVTQPAGGMVSIVGNEAVFDPQGDFDYLVLGESATVAFIYTVTNADGLNKNELVTVTVNGIANRPPTALDDSGSTDQDTAVIINAIANDTDPDASNTLLISALDQPAKGSASITSGNQIRFDPGDDFDSLAAGVTETVTFDYTISDGEGGTDTATVTVTVTGLDDPTVTNPDQGTTFEGSPVTIDVISNDSDPDTSDNPLSVAAVTQPADADDGSVTFAGGNVTFTPGSNFESLSPGQSATTTFQYETSTGATETVTVTVNGLDDPTVTNPDSGVTDEDTPINIDVLANDSDADAVDNPLTIQLVSQPNNPNDGTVVNNGTDVTFTPGITFDSLGPGDSATTTFTYMTDTGQTEIVVVTVTGVNDAPVANDDFVVSTTDIDPVTINVASNDTDVDGTLDLTSIDLDPTTAGQQTSLVVSGEGTWTVGGGGNVTFTPDPGITNQPSTITYSIADNDGATSTASLDLSYSAADVWFGNDESTSLDGPDFTQSRNLISGAAQQMSFATGDLAFNAALFTWADSSSQQLELGITADQTQFVNDSATYSRNHSGGTDIGQGIVFGTQQILNHVAAMQASSDPRADVPQVMVMLTDALDSQILNDSSLLADAQTAKNAGIILVFVAIQEAQDNPVAVARLQQAATLDQNNDPLVITANSYADIDSGEIADLLNAIREAAAAGLLPPIVIDMDGDGVEFDDIENGILFDADGDGVKERVAWADEDDAVLVYDQNGNNDIDGLNEISFARYAGKIGATDLEGLRHFDTNNDLILDANDAEFESFKLWQDKNGDGIVDEGEMQTLTEAGIESLELVSDGRGYYTAGGDVQVHGEATVNYADGTKGTLADSTFKYEELDGGDELEVLTDQGEVLDVSDSGAVPEPATPDLLEGGAPTGEEMAGHEVVEGGAMPGTSAEDDMAAADAAMS